MTSRPTQNDRAHNFRIVGTIRDDIELKLRWRSLESKLLAAAAYEAPRRILYLRFRSGETYRYFTFPTEMHQAFLDAESQGKYFLSHIRDQFPYEHLPRR
ncbi:MAG TPA: KTSC domain-containing protein [Bryobacteraceae bacterium]|nr:KTSC domain-containing protein [Bryobacteraceae bacterium]